MSLRDLHQKYPWKSVNKFLPIAKQHGFSKQDVQSYFNKNIARDKLNVQSKHYFLPIFGRQKGVYQFDTLVQSRSDPIPAFLVVININSRKGYAYPMNSKGTDDVMKALQEFFSEVHDVSQMTSDQDSAYLSSRVVSLMNSHNVDYRTTEDNNHNILGIINRFIKTLRDMINNVGHSQSFTVSSMKSVINAYNNSKHSSTGKTPNEFTDADETKYIDSMEERTVSVKCTKGFELKSGDKVKIIIDKPTIGKKRTNLSDDYYLVESLEGNGYYIKGEDQSVAYYPRHKLVPATGGKLAKTVNNDKRGIIIKIQSYNTKTDKYKVVYANGDTDAIKSKYMRETRPTHLGPLERKYWKGKNKVPPAIMGFKGLV